MATRRVATQTVAKEVKQENKQENIQPARKEHQAEAECGDSTILHWKQKLLKRHAETPMEALEKEEEKSHTTDATSKDSTTTERWKLDLARQESVVLSETPVTCFREVWGAPKKRVLHLRRVQKPPPILLHNEWSLPDGGSWGYAFNYSGNEACFYQLQKGESYNPSGVKAMLSSTDWSVLCLLGSTVLKPEASQDEEHDSEERKRAGKRIVSSMVWETKNSASSRWYFRATHQSCTVGEKIAEDFVLEYFSSECGVFQTALRIPLEEWVKVMEEYGEKIKLLYVTSRAFQDILWVKRVL